MDKKPFLKWVLFLLLPFAFFLGCAGKDVKTIEGDPEILYREGLTLFNKRDYPEALKKFEQLKSSFPDSPPYTTWAEMKIGDCHFFKKEYVEAIAAYEEFKKIHPAHEEMPYVQYQIGMSYFNQMLAFDRDQTFTKKALSNFEYLIANYPPSLFTEKAKEKMEVCKKRLADHEFYIGHYYFKHGNYRAASLRFQELLEKFPKMTQEDEALLLLGKSCLELDQEERAIRVFTKIITEYPKSSYYDEAKMLLEQGLNERTVKGTKKKTEVQEVETVVFSLVRFEEERRKFLPFDSQPPVINKQVLPDPHPKAEIEIEPEEEKRLVVPLISQNPSGEKEKSKRGVPTDPGLSKPVDTSQPIDIISDKVETYSKENLIIFKGNVIARQKDMVIYADLIEAVTIEKGKGIERVVASGNVKIQQGLRVASCQKAVFHNLDQKVILTGDPKISEGENMVSGDEIVLDIAQNRVEVKGGEKARGKAKVHPGWEFEKAK